MELPLLCAVAAAARAAAFLDRPDAGDQWLEPPAPELTAFRRMAYLWQEGRAWLPIGDRLRLWLDFLRSQGTTAVRLRVDGRAGVVLTHPPATEWRVLEEEGDARMLGTAVEHSLQPTHEAHRPPGPSVQSGLGDPAAALRAALHESSQRASSEARVRLRKAVPILDSAGGSAAPERGWPYAVLPDAGYTPSDRRLVAAIITAWPEAATEPLLDVAAAALMAVVNSVAPRQPVK